MFYNTLGDIMEHLIFHIDVNNAFLSWTAVDMLKKGAKIDIRTIPAIIGGDETKRHGVVLAKSNIAKQFGIKTGEPIYFARQKCPNLKVYESNHQMYRRYSDELYKIFREYSDKVERFSIDECFLDMRDFIGKNENPIQIAQEISTRIKKEKGYTVNIGIAQNKLLAKMASDFEKPDKIHTLWKEEIPTKMWPLKVSELLMVGKKSLPKLERMGIRTIGDLAKSDKEVIYKTFGKFGKVIWEYANGIDTSEVNYLQKKPKGIGNSVTLPQDCNNREELDKVLLQLTEQVTYRLRKEKMIANVVNIQIKDKFFRVFSHQKKMEDASSSTRIIYSEVKKLMDELYVEGTKIRLVGVRVDNLIEEKDRQISLFDNKQNEKQEKIDTALDKLKDKFGYNSIKRAGEMKK